MISILVIDDNAEKIKAIKTAICENSSILNSDIEVATDRNNGKRLLIDRKFDLIILDLSLPERFGDNPEQDGGAQFLNEINLSTDFNVPLHIIGLTAYTDLKEKYSETFSEYLWHLIIYEIEYNNWKTQLLNYINYLVKSKNIVNNMSKNAYDFDIAIVTVLTASELKQVKNLPIVWKEEKYEDDDTYYYTGQIEKNDKRVRIVVASTNNVMGMPASAVLSLKMIERFRPRYLVMLGICAGIEGRGNIGDPIVADRVWDYGSGKHTKSEDSQQQQFKPYINQITLDTSLSSAFNRIIQENLFVGEIQNKWHISYNSAMRAKIGAFASGSAVIANENMVESIKAQHGQILGFDMESYGLFYAASQCTYPKPKPFIIKSISDFGDSNKNNPNKDEFQSYAAYTSAQYFYNFCLGYLF